MSDVIRSWPFESMAKHDKNPNFWCREELTPEGRPVNPATVVPNLRRQAVWPPRCRNWWTLIHSPSQSNSRHGRLPGFSTLFEDQERISLNFVLVPEQRIAFLFLTNNEGFFSSKCYSRFSVLEKWQTKMNSTIKILSKYNFKVFIYVLIWGDLLLPRKPNQRPDDPLRLYYLFISHKFYLKNFN
jgi:hypothetical protein